MLARGAFIGLLTAPLLALAATPAFAMHCSRFIPAPHPELHCTSHDIDTGARGCSGDDCEIETNGCEVDWPPLCYGLDLTLHQIFGWSVDVGEPRPGDIVAGEPATFPRPTKH